jgi:hypothetical protein
VLAIEITETIESGRSLSSDLLPLVRCLLGFANKRYAVVPFNAAAIPLEMPSATPTLLRGAISS